MVPAHSIEEVMTPGMTGSIMWACSYCIVDQVLLGLASMGLAHTGKHKMLIRLEPTKKALQGPLIEKHVSPFIQVRNTSLNYSLTFSVFHDCDVLTIQVLT